MVDRQVEYLCHLHTNMQLLALLASASIAAAFVGRKVPTKTSRLHENFGFGEDSFHLSQLRDTDVPCRFC